MLAKRFIQFNNNVTDSCNTKNHNIVKTISNMRLSNNYSIMGANSRHL